MDFIALIGLVGIGFVLALSVPDIFVHPATYIQKESVIMVFFGVIMLFVTASTGKDIKNTIAAIGVLFRGGKNLTSREIVDKLVELSIISQKDGRGALEGAGEGFDDGFLDNGLQMIVNKLPPEFIRVVLENEISETETRHAANADNLKLIGALAPMCGMFGTIIGIIQVLKNMKDPKTVGPAMSLALITSMYGVFISGFIMSPLANRLTKKSEEEILNKVIVIEGIIMISKGEIPIKVETYLSGFLSRKNKKKEDDGVVEKNA
ncbi:MAG: hypothetical protein A2Y40_10515 [Candidatus Margulisbacteria bacterium GWF2_35_9]|nr:MAG: hypothetical protein A2Y40_10515 [Candidatus Margulisbacteria bacterium GWF2_35_9]